MTAHASSRFALFTAVLLTLLSGCGFQLRSDQAIPTEKQNLKISVSRDEAGFLPSLHRSMKIASVQQSDDAIYQLHILNSHWGRNSVTLDRSAKVDEYSISLMVEYQLGRTNKPDVPVQTIRSERIYTYDSNAATASGEKESMLRAEIYETLGNRLMRRYLIGTD